MSVHRNCFSCILLQDCLDAEEICSCLGYVECWKSEGPDPAIAVKDMPMNDSFSFNWDGVAYPCELLRTLERLYALWEMILVEGYALGGAGIPDQGGLEFVVNGGDGWLTAGSKIQAVCPDALPN